jgi:hypothetical protein
VNAPGGFRFDVRKSGDVVISHHGRVAATLRGRKALAFLDDISRADDQELMARLTGNYRRGNERASARHPRNQQT